MSVCIPHLGIDHELCFEISMKECATPMMTPTGELFHVQSQSMVQTRLQLMYCPNPIYLAFAYYGLSAIYIQVVARRETMLLEIQRVR